jgi:hypothetical protein
LGETIDMKTKLQLLLPLAVLATCGIGPTSSTAAEPKSAPSKSSARSKLDDSLLEGLGDPAEDESLGKAEEKPRQDKSAPDEPAAIGKSKSKAPAKNANPRSSGGDLDDELLRGLGDGEDIELGGKPGQPAEGGKGANPLVDLGRQMREVESRIAQAKSDDETQKLQDRIASELQKLIKQLQRRKKSSSSSSSSSNKDQQTAEREKVEQPATGGAGQQAAADSPAKESTEMLKDRKTEKTETAQLDEALKDIWGQLPEHLRQQMKQYAKEELLPKYELQIEEYFRALAKGQRERP